MNSSTSNSRAIYSRIALTIAVGMFSSLLLVRLYTHVDDTTAETFLGRVLEAKAALPDIVYEDKNTVIFFGSSMVQEGFSPREFDGWMLKRGIEIKSFNFGFGGLNPLYQEMLSRGIRDAYLEKGKRLRLAIIEFNPFQTTVTRREGSRAIDDSVRALLESPQELLDIARTDPTRGLRLLNIRYLRGGISAEMITSDFGRVFRDPMPLTLFVETPIARERLRNLLEQSRTRFREDFPDHDNADWSYKWQGGGPIRDERSIESLLIIEELNRLRRAPFHMDNDRTRRINTADIIDLNFDTDLMHAFIQVVHNLQQISDHVVVVMMPRNNEWIEYAPDAIERLNTVLDSIEREINIPIRNYQSLDRITPQMFYDTTHLSRFNGAVVFTHFLVEEYAAMLQLDNSTH